MIITSDIHKQLAMPERKAILQYFTFMGVQLIGKRTKVAFMGDYEYTSIKNYHYKLVNKNLYIVPDYRKDSPKYTLEELKLLASYFHAL